MNDANKHTSIVLRAINVLGNLIWKRPGFVPFEPTLSPNMISLIKNCQIGRDGNKSGTFEDQLSVHFGCKCLKVWERFYFLPIWYNLDRRMCPLPPQLFYTRSIRSGQYLNKGNFKMRWSWILKTKISERIHTLA